MRSTYADDRYRVLREIGRGGMSVVYEVEDTRLGARRALKALHPPLLSQPEIVSRFRNEARVLAALTHPHIVGVVDVGEDDGGLYLVMELLPGGTLAELAARRGGLSPLEASEAMLGVLDALRLAHANGVVHRDVKPQNILLAEGGVPKLADFGIAQLATDDLTRTGMLLGSWATMAPEQRSDAKKVGPASDLWSAAATIVALVEGRAVSDLHVLEQRVATLTRWPAPLAAVLHRALAFAPEQRFLGAADMAEALRAALAEVRGSAVASMPETPTEPLSRVGPSSPATPSATAAPARTRRVAGAAALVAVAAAAGLGLGLRDDVRGVLAPEAPEAPDLVRIRAYLALPPCTDAPATFEGTFAPRLMTNEPGGREGGGGRLVDVDGDGFVDLLASHTFGSEFRVFWGDASGVLPEASTHVPGSRMTGLPGVADAGDLDGDGWPELVSVAAEEMGFVISRGTGTRAFAPGVQLDSGNVPLSVRVSDWDGDGRNDLVYLVGVSTPTYVMWRAGTGSVERFEGERALTTDALAFDVADIDADGHADLLVADAMNVRVHPGSADHRLQPVSLRVPHHLSSVTALRVLQTPAGPRIHVGGAALPDRFGDVVVAPDGSACRQDLTGLVPFDFGYFTQDDRVDHSSIRTCGYCTTQYHVMIGRP